MPRDFFQDNIRRGSIAVSPTGIVLIVIGGRCLWSGLR